MADPYYGSTGNYMVEEDTPWYKKTWDWLTDFNFEDDTSGLLETSLDFLKSKDDSGVKQWDLAKVVGSGAGLASILGLLPDEFTQAQIPPSGYQGTVPKYTASRERVLGTNDPTRRPGSGGQRYFTDTIYTPEGGELPTELQTTQAATLQAANLANPYSYQVPTPATETATATAPNTGSTLLSDYVKTKPVETVVNARRGGEIRSGIANIMAGNPYNRSYNIGGIANRPNQFSTNLSPRPNSGDTFQGRMPSRYLSSVQDGMADTIPASIDNKDPAALSGGEFVIAADVVSGLGNGNSDAGAKELYNLMDRVRQARTGTAQQGRQINPQRMMMG